MKKITLFPSLGNMMRSLIPHRISIMTKRDIRLEDKIEIKCIVGKLRPMTSLNSTFNVFSQMDTLGNNG